MSLEVDPGEELGVGERDGDEHGEVDKELQEAVPFGFAGDAFAGGTQGMCDRDEDGDQKEAERSRRLLE